MRSGAPSWIWAPRIARAALTLASGPSAFEAMLGMAAAVSRGSSMPTRDCEFQQQPMCGRVLLVGDEQHCWRRLSAAGVPRELSSTFEPRDAEGEVRSLALEDLSTLAEALGRVRPVLAIVAGLPPQDAPLVAALADLAEQHASALVAVSAEPVDPRLEALAHTALSSFERPSGRYVLRRGLRHVASRVGQRGASIGFALHGEIVTWERIAEPDPVEPEAHAEPEPARTLGTQLDAVVESVIEDVLADDPERVLEVVDPESAFLLEQLAQGPMRARDVQRRGAELGYSVRTLRRRADALGIERRKSGVRGPWMWVAPPSSGDASRGV